MTISAQTWAKPRTKAEMAVLANKVFLNDNSSSVTSQHQKRESGKEQQPMTLVLEKEALSVYASSSSSSSSSSSRFAIISNDDFLPEVLGYSDTAFAPEMKNLNFRWWLEAMDNACSYYVRKGINTSSITPGSAYESSVSPLVTAHWGQEAPFYDMCPMGTESGSDWQGYESSGRCVTGCVATAMAQILYYHQAPKHGQGTHSVRVKQKDGTYETYTVDYDEAVYDWDNMLDRYTEDKYTTEQGNAVAQLMYHCGVAADMEYYTDGSGTYDNLACDGLKRNFGFNDATYYERKSYTEAEWMNMIFRELSEKRPILYGGDDMSLYSGHCFILDGYDSTGKVHVNWGWEGEDDGYFDIATLSVAGYSWSDNQDMVIGIEGDGSSGTAYAVDIELTEAGTLADSIAARQIPLDSIAYITLAGNINSKDMATIRTIGRTGILRKLDLKDTFVADSLLPDSAFAGCAKLRYVTLPECIRQIGNYAFTGCNAFSEMRLYKREKPLANSTAFKGVDLDNSTLLVRAATKTMFSRALPWKNFGQIGEFGIAVSARNCSRDYGVENPQFYWTVDGGAIDGEPEITCDATKDSPAGRYTLHVSRGTVKNPEVDFVDGYMIVNAPSDINIVKGSLRSVHDSCHDISGHTTGHYPPGTIVVTNGKKYIAR